MVQLRNSTPRLWSSWMTNQKKVLIIDPSPIFRQTLKEVIKARVTYAEIHEANSAGQAEYILKKARPDVVFIDIALPLGDGIRFISSIKGMSPQSSVVVLTSHDSEEYEAASIEQGADYFISKEVSGDYRLIDVIRKTI